MESTPEQGQPNISTPTDNTRTAAAPARVVPDTVLESSWQSGMR